MTPPTLYKKCAHCIYFGGAKRKREEEEGSTEEHLSNPLDLLVQAVTDVKNSTETLQKERDEINAQFTELKEHHIEAEKTSTKLRGDLLALRGQFNDLETKHNEAIKKCKCANDHRLSNKDFITKRMNEIMERVQRMHPMPPLNLSDS